MVLISIRPLYSLPGSLGIVQIGQLSITVQFWGIRIAVAMVGQLLLLLIVCFVVNGNVNVIGFVIVVVVAIVIFTVVAVTFVIPFHSI